MSLPYLCNHGIRAPYFENVIGAVGHVHQLFVLDDPAGDFRSNAVVSPGDIGARIMRVIRLRFGGGPLVAKEPLPRVQNASRSFSCGIQSFETSDQLFMYRIPAPFLVHDLVAPAGSQPSL